MQSQFTSLMETVSLGFEIDGVFAIVAVDPTLDNLMVLGLLVIIRTFLSWSLDVELEGRWPWQRAASATSDDSRP